VSESKSPDLCLDASKHSFRGLVPNEDAADIVANTFLQQITEDQMVQIGLGFLKHRHRE
jgi:hypothetical protein